MWKLTTKSGSIYTIRRTVDAEGEPHYWLSADNVPNPRCAKVDAHRETEIYVPQFRASSRDPAPVPSGAQWFNTLGYHLTFIEVLGQSQTLFPTGEVSISRVVEITTSEV